MYVLDTNIISYSLSNPDGYPHLIRRINETESSWLWISVVTAEELIAWRFNQIRNSRNQKYPQIIKVYANFLEILNDLKKLQVLPFDEAAYREYLTISCVQIRAGTNDRRIAATALSNDFTLVTHNVQHFEGIPRLKVEDWTIAPLS